MAAYGMRQTADSMCVALYLRASAPKNSSARGMARSSIAIAQVSCASIVGGLLGYAIGALLWGAVAEFFFRWIPGFTPEVFGRVQALYLQYGFWIVFAAGFTPIPYKVFTICSGVMSLNLPLFLLASSVSRYIERMEFDREFWRRQYFEKRAQIAEGRRAAAKIDGLERSRRQLAQKTADIAGIGADGARRQCTVGALPPAKGKVDVEIIYQTTDGAL